MRAWRNCRRTLAEIHRIEYLAVGGRGGAGSRAPPRGPRGTWRAMRIVLAGFGTRGDVQPMVALAQALSDRGHSCSVFVPPNIAEWVTSFGLDTTPVGMDYVPAALRCRHRARSYLRYTDPGVFGDRVAMARAPKCAHSPVPTRDIGR